MRKLKCPQCRIANLYLKNVKSESLPVYITIEGEIIPKRSEDSLEDFDINEIFCLGCSWHGSVKNLVKY